MARNIQEDRRVDQENENSIPTSQLEPDYNYTEARRTPLPKFQLFLVLLIQFAEPITARVIYPFVNQFIRDSGITNGDDKNTGYYAGVIESAFFFTEAATVFQWGRLSDRFGRRPILLLGPLGLTFAMLRFGYSTSFWPMILSRCIQGVFNGNIGVSKTVIVELTDATNIGDAFALPPLVWYSGTTIAPIIGGVLSNPAARWPNVFGKLDLFNQHPYLLPCLVASIHSLFSFVIGFLGLQETHSSVSRVGGVGNAPEESEVGSTDPLLCHGEPRKYGTADFTCSSSSENQHTVTPTLSSILKSRQTVLLLVNYALLALTSMSYSVLVPLIYSTSIENGGLGLTPYQIGLVMGITSLVMVLIQVNLFGKLIRKYGGNRLYSFAYACYFISFLTFPVSVHLARRNGVVGLDVCTSIMIQLLFQLGTSLCYGAIEISVAESAPRAILGSINGLFQMTSCLARTLAPTFASSLFSYSLQTKSILGGNLVYAVFLLIISIGIGFSWALPGRKDKTSTS